MTTEQLEQNRIRVKKHYDANKLDPEFIKKRNVKNTIQRAKKKLTKDSENVIIITD